MSNLPVIEFKDVSMQYQIGEHLETVLHDVSFKVQANNFSILFGPSGSGKTTILNMLLGFLPPSTGKVLIDGVNLYDLTPNDRAKFRSANFGIVYQTNNWVNSLSVAENVALPLYLSGASKDAALKKAKDSLERVDMLRYAKYRPSVLSTGQQQRVSMARATVETPLIMVADEPTGNLDSKNGDAILQLITSYKNHDDATILLVTHNLEYLPLSDHRLNIKDGVVTEEEGVYFEGVKSNPLVRNRMFTPQPENQTIDGVIS